MNVHRLLRLVQVCGRYLRRLRRSCVGTVRACIAAVYADHCAVFVLQPWEAFVHDLPALVQRLRSLHAVHAQAALMTYVVALYAPLGAMVRPL